MIEVLSAIDWFIAGVAVVASLIFSLRILKTAPSAESLATAPERTHQLREDTLALAVLVYLSAVAILSLMVRRIDEQGQSALAGLAVGGGSQLIGLGTCLLIVSANFQGGIRRFLWGKSRNSILSIDPRTAPDLTRPTTPTCGGMETPGDAEGEPQCGETRSSVENAGTPGAPHLFWLVGTCVVIALGLCTLVLMATKKILSFLAPGYVYSVHPTIETLNKEEQPLGIVIGLWIGAAGIAPLAEEVFFRGLLQSYLVGFLRSRWRAIALASLAFAAVHIAQPHAIPALIVLSVIMGYAYERTGAMLAPVVIHALFNLKTLVWSALGGVLH